MWPGYKTERRHRARSARAVPAARRRARRARRGRLADGRVRGRRCAGLGGGPGGGRSAGRARARSARRTRTWRSGPRHADRADGSARPEHPRRGRRGREVRRAAGVDPRLPRARRATPRMATPACLAGAPKSAAAVLAKFGHLERIPADWTHWGVNASRARRRWPRRWQRERDRRSCFANWPRCGRTSRCSTTWTNCAGRARRRPLRSWADGSTEPPACLDALVDELARPPHLCALAAPV